MNWSPAMSAQLTAVFRKVPEEIPGANVQEPSLEEARNSLVEAVQLVLEANRTLARVNLGESADLIREPFHLDPAA
jgi:hypothetical protein